jgi:hypothetical protein
MGTVPVSRQKGTVQNAGFAPAFSFLPPMMKLLWQIPATLPVDALAPLQED